MPTSKTAGALQRCSSMILEPAALMFWKHVNHVLLVQRTDQSNQGQFMLCFCCCVFWFAVVICTSGPPYYCAWEHCNANAKTIYHTAPLSSYFTYSREKTTKIFTRQWTSFSILAGNCDAEDVLERTMFLMKVNFYFASATECRNHSKELKGPWKSKKHCTEQSPLQSGGTLSASTVT